MTEREGSPGEAQTREDGFARLEAGWRGLLDAVDGIPADRLAEPGACGEWSVKDLMGHVAFWDEVAADRSNRLAAGGENTEVDWQALNEREAAARAGRPAAELRAEMERAHAHVVAAFRALPDLNPADYAGDTFEHYDEHAAEIRAWRARVGI